MGRESSPPPPRYPAAVMCRVFGCVATEPVSIRHELLEAENPLIRQSEDHDSGSDSAAYERADGGRPRLVRFPEAAYSDGNSWPPPGCAGGSQRARAARDDGRSDLKTTVRSASTATRSVTTARSSPIRACSSPACSRRPAILTPSTSSTCSCTATTRLTLWRACGARCDGRRAVALLGLNVLFSDGEKLYAYRLGRFDLHWVTRPGQLLVASEKLTGETWHSVGQDVLLALDPDDLEEPHAERLLGDEIVAGADIHRIDKAPHLRGAERGAAAAERARSAASAAAAE